METDPLLYGYLQASMIKQDVEHAKAQLKQFAAEHKTIVAAWFVENESWATLHRPQLMRLLDTAEAGDAILIESIDRLTRIHTADWEKLKTMIRLKNLRIVAVDLPTTYLSLKSDELTDSIMIAINELIIDILAAVSRKDYIQRRERQKQGIAKAKMQGKYRGRRPNHEIHNKIAKMLRANMTYSEIKAALGVSNSTIAKVRKREHE